MYITIEDRDRKELIEAIMNGRTFSCNHSPTLRAKIIALQGGVAHLKVVANEASYMQEYNVEHADKIGNRFELPAQIAHNAIYF